ncbi:sarcosine oxidase subunit delta [Methylocella sp.]|uniref:sarcosine oxidase subunit delta n=1 Tax=Methylocella sp. TaxID=1978226 RepID=UPI0035B3932E
MLINCPYCGPRDLGEFFVAGEARPRPQANVEDLDAEATRAACAEALYLREDPAGSHVEHWFHASGCQSWLTLRRDTRTHEIFSVTLASQKENAP